MDRAGRLLHVQPEHAAPLRLVDDVGNTVALAEDVELLVELVGDVELVVGKELGEGLVGRQQRRRDIHVVGAAVGIARIVIAAVGGKGRFLSSHDQAGLAESGHSSGRAWCGTAPA